MAANNAVRSCTIVLHDERTSKLDVLGGLDILPVGSIALLSSKDANDILVLADGRASGPRDISLHSRLGSKFGFVNRASGKITLILDDDPVTASHVNLFFRDQYLMRSDIWLMTKQLEGRIIYDNSSISYLGHEVATVQDIHLNGRQVRSALVQQGKTKAIVRSGSARFTILVQLSREMLAYTESCYLVFERLIEGYLTELFQRWDHVKARHVVSIVVFGRFEHKHSNESKDFYSVLNLNSSNGCWPELLAPLRKLFNDTAQAQNISAAADGNLLEALHLAIADFLHDTRALHLANTGTSVIAITAGTGAFSADYSLLMKTTQMLLGNSVGVDIVSLAMVPQHPVPLFRYRLGDNIEYALPHWADISYWSPDMSPSVSRAPRTLKGMAATSLASLSTPYDEPSDAIAAMDLQDLATFATLRSNGVLVSNHSNIIYPSTSHGSTKTITASSRAPHTMLDTATPQAPILKQRNSTSSIATTLSVSKANRSSASSILAGRKISVGPRGLAPLKSTAITTISEAYANLDKDTSTTAKFTPNEAKSGLANQIRASLKRRPSSASVISRLTDTEDKATRPIDIHTAIPSALDAPPVDPLARSDQTHVDAFSKLARSNSKTPRVFEGLAGSPVKPSVDPGAEAQTPWLTLLNPCNIRKDNMRVASQYRQWQHVFPKAIDSGEFKWTSMCTPASLPLYNDLLPSTEDLRDYYKRTTRRIVCAQAGEPGKRPHELLEQLVTLRLAHGFQIVARPSSTEQAHIIMSIGADYHELQCLSDLELEVIEYSNKQATHAPDVDVSQFLVQAWHDSTTRTVSLRPNTDIAVDWAAIDQSVDSNLATESLFRMRFVLLPIDVPGKDQRDLADDEKRIEGIQRLTQQWQRHRVLNAEDQSHHISVAPKRGSRTEDEVDHNPLAIEYHTRDPGALINSQDVTVSGHDDVSSPLFADSERYHTSNFDVAKLVRRMQDPPPHGIDVRDRRWFARIHLKCFRGDEMTNWLLSAFKDLKTREHAVEIGNLLMKEGVFTHVRHKHDFMDGNYFYQIAQAHRTSEYPNVIASVFNRVGGRSVPPTPSTEVRMSPQVRPSRGDSASTGPGSAMLAPVEKRQVLLTQTLKYNVDPARRSEQEEVINIHYDRIHNPENCYHIYVDWSLSSPMLVRDAVSKWTTLVEPYGLRLVQVPWLEAAKHIERHPFEQPRYVKLVLDPPDRIPATPLFNGSTSLMKTVEDRQFYYKSILRKLGFVLDAEASYVFSSNIDVVVTWGIMDFGMTQFVHQSGLVIAQISTNDDWDFLLLPNNLLTEKSQSSLRFQPKDTVLGILQDFDTLANDAKKLKQVYDESQKPRVIAPSPFVRAALAATDIDVPPMQLSPIVAGRNN